MTAVATNQRRGGGYLDRPAPSGLADVIEIILDKGIVIDAYARVSLVGIEILTLDARVVIASVDTYLRFADATNRLDLERHSIGLTELPNETLDKGAEGKVKGAIEGVKEGITGQRRDPPRTARAALRAAGRGSTTARAASGSPRRGCRRGFPTHRGNGQVLMGADLPIAVRGL